MGKVGTRLPGFCLNRMRSHVRVRSPPIQTKINNSGNNGGVQNEEKVKVMNSDHVEDQAVKPKEIMGRKIMIVVDSSVEAKSAVLWALSHTVQTQDLLILLHVTKPSKFVTGHDKSTIKDRASRGYEVVNSLKKLCQQKRPEIEIETEVVFGKENKGEIIVEEAKKKGAGLLVIGQKKRSMTWRLIMMWAKASNRGSGGIGIVDYCIQNADCMAVAVRRKSKKHGGFLITTKRHKDFWLLA
ncbi:Adenine nucleotide alpha hydrolases-like superfamily protein [Euphorbia peplus]|nr:Adenine nucleotide alpha hydrolases-like superfamily protein [Euphorbia peplus]